MSALKILIVEDSEIASDILTQALESDTKLHVVGVARNGQEALTLLPRLSPDLITMDVYMPIMDGFETVERIMADYPTPILVITSSSLKEDVQISLRMLEAGALDVIEKPSLTNEGQWAQQQRELVARVKLLAGVKVITHLRGRRNHTKALTLPPLSPKPPLAPSNPDKFGYLPAPQKPATSPLDRVGPKPPPDRFGGSIKPLPARRKPGEPEIIQADFPANPFYQAIAIASSTGGPTALLRILQALPSNLPCGMLIVQHISDGFTQGLVDWLQRETALQIKMAQNGDRVTPGLVLVAPDGRDMVINPNGQIVATKDGALHLIRPSADVMMRSVGQFYGNRAIGLVLTGMGNDGANGLLAMAQAGAYTIAQDETSSLIYGMPKAATDNGAAREIKGLNNIAARLVQLLQMAEERGPSYNGGLRR